MSSPNAESTLDEFIPYLVPETKEGSEVKKEEPVAESPVVPKFEVGQKEGENDSQFLANAEFWKSLLGDAWVSKEIEKVITERLQGHLQEALKRIEQEDKPKILQDAWAKGEKEGFEKGMALSQEKASLELTKLKEEYKLEQDRWIQNQSALLDRLNAIGLELLNSKKAILQDHEKAWCRSMKELLEKFQVKGAVETSGALERWITERVAEFGEKKKITVFVSNDEYQTLCKEIASTANFPFELAIGEDLKSGQMRAECGDGGIFFSRPDSLQKIDEWLNRFFGNGEIKLES